ncbi:TPA: hypothetical protein ACLBCM_000474 [Neisseria meningitidis]|nr:hypothetical protein [Neisseria meningitidis]
MYGIFFYQPYGDTSPIGDIPLFLEIVMKFDTNNACTDAIYRPENVFQQQDVREILLGQYSYAGSQILRNIVRSLYKGVPVELYQVSQLDQKHYAIFEAILAHYRKYGESEQLRQIVCEMNREAG